MGFLKSPEIPLEGLIKIPLERLIKIPLEGNFFRFPRESEKTRTRAVGFLKTPEIPLEGNFFRFPREAEKSRTKAVRFLKSTEIPLEGLIFHPLHVADWPRVYAFNVQAPIHCVHHRSHDHRNNKVSHTLTKMYNSPSVIVS